MATNTTPSAPNHLEPSELGTKEYWDTLYTTELTNHASDPSDRGTVWFDDSDAEAKLLEFLDEQTTEPCYHDDDGDEQQQQQQQQPPLDRATTSFLDLGCGNGSLLAALRDDGWEGRALGVDYSEKSVALARQIHSTTTTTTTTPSSSHQQKQEEQEHEPQPHVSSSSSEESNTTTATHGVPDLEFAAWDLLASPYHDAVLTGAQRRGWDVVLDKGTFDAISLSEARDDRGRRVCEAYRGRVLPLVRPGGLFVVTSCNWTEEELEAWFGSRGEEGSADGRTADGPTEGDAAAGRFVRVGRVRYPSFSFGGVKGQTISTLCFQRK